MLDFIDTFGRTLTILYLEHNTNHIQRESAYNSIHLQIFDFT